ncbi:MAG: two-component system, cell cycle sensor histidine kinase and response regulator CckA [Gaiellaceae bacterium]|nr:two-component system, cell cycle sensor histidine kinase and response regulator CckA [Gaiellaceae bacterium]
MIPGLPLGVTPRPSKEPTAQRGLRLVELVRRLDGGDDEPSTLSVALERMRQAEDTLRAIGAGEVDAFLISDEQGRRVFTLSTADRLYRMFVENMRDGAATLSTDGLILYANQRLAELLSCSKDELVGSPFAKFVAGDFALGLDDATGAGATVELELLDAGGVTVPALIGVTRLEVEGDALVCVTLTDLRAQKGLEQQLRQAQRMEAIGSLAGGIAHDFNNLLTVIRGYSSILVHENAEPETREAIERIDQAAVRATELTAQLLAFSRQQVMQPEVTNANAVVTEVLVLLERLLGEHILLERRFEPELASILVDRSQLGQVVLNLAVNGRDAMPEGGTLSIQTDNVRLDAAYAADHRDVEPGPYILLQVTDTGTGMNQETRDRVFDPFFTTKEEGTGLGLATVYGIIKQSGGHAAVYSEPGMGTTFKVYFPTTNAPIVPTPSPIEGLPPEGGETILLVEDDDQIRVLISGLLKSYGYTVLVAENGAQALALAADTQTHTIDVLLTDVVMPVMNGRQVADELMALLPGLRVIFTSGYPADTILRHGIAEGHTAFLQKPYLVDELARKIREVLAGSGTV